MARILGPSRAARRLGAAVGDDCRILSFHISGEPWLVQLGDRVTIAAGVQFITHDGGGWLVRDRRGRRFRYASIKIYDDVFVGLNAILLPGVVIESRCIVAAGSVVSRSIPRGHVVAGNPARIIGRFDDYESRALDWSSESELPLGPDRKRVAMAYDSASRPFLDTGGRHGDHIS